MSKSALRIDPAAYTRHALHSGDRTWLETNCYVDLWIELPSSLGLEPTAALAFTVAADFEGDQWLFHKQSTADLYELFGIDVQELAIWRPLIEHATEQVARGRVPLIEVDSFYLPDTQGVSYGTAHAKTTIGVERIDAEARELGYFHNAGYFTLRGADFDALFPAAPLPSVPVPVAEQGAVVLPPYVEFAKFDRLKRYSNAELVRLSLAQLRRHLQRVPSRNPFAAFAERVRADIAALSGLDGFHQYAFATLRQFGSCFELAGSYLRWLEQGGERELLPLAEHFEAIGSGARALQMRTARAVALGREFDPLPAVASMGEHWDAALSALQTRYGA